MSREPAVVPLRRFAKVLRAQRRHRHLSQGALARLAGIDQGAVSNYELALNAPTPPAMWRLRSVLPNLPEPERKTHQVFPAGIPTGPRHVDEAAIATRSEAAQRLIRARLAAGLRLVDVETRTGVAAALLSRYENDKERLTERQEQRILRAIGGGS